MKKLLFAAVCALLLLLNSMFYLFSLISQYFFTIFSEIMFNADLLVVN